MYSALISRIARDVGLPESSVGAVTALFQDGATTPFIARYRKELTGGMDEAKVRCIYERMMHYSELISRRAVILKSIAEQGKLAHELQTKIENCFIKSELEDFLLPFKPKRKSKATEAMAKGMEPLAEYLWNQEPDAWSLEEHADVFIDPEKGVSTREEALRAACDIVAEWISENIDVRKTLREMIWNDGFLISKVVPAKSAQKTKYTMYYDRREPVATIPSHRVLAIRRGTKEGVLTSGIEFDEQKGIESVLAAVIQDRESVFSPVLEAAARDSYARLIRPVIEIDLRTELKERADREAIRVFQDNLANLLLSPPAGPIVVTGIDPGKGAERKLAVVDANGQLVESSTISPSTDLEGTRATLKELISRHAVRALAVGNGTDSRELDTTLRQLLEEEKLENVFTVGVNDAGVSGYAISRLSREEFPDLDVATRRAVTIARRLQDPLIELTKVDPKLIGVGQYQHDVDQKELHRSLVAAVQCCVNQVGVCLNTAPSSLLRYVAGLNEALARKIVAHRATTGPFRSRATLVATPGINDKTFQQAAGFLRIRDGENVLDRTAVHPEHYGIVDAMAASAGIPVSELIENIPLLSQLKLDHFVTDTIGLPTLSDIVAELAKPGRDPRRAFTVPRYRSDVKQIEDLKEGMTVEGTVTNVTNFGAFVDIGVHQDGLIHLSQMSNRFIRDPRIAVKVGDVVKVKVISVEVETRRIGLSMKALMPPAPRRRRKSQRRVGRAPEAGPTQAASGSEAPASSDTVSRSAAQATGSNTSRPSSGSRDGSHRSRGSHRRRRDRFRKPSPDLPEPGSEIRMEPKLPEPTLQEKIAILQSKFRGIS